MVQEFNPDNVLLSQKPDGELLPNMNNLILQDVRDTSIVTQLGRYEEMNTQEKTFTFQTDGVSAYWVDEGEKIQTTKPAIAQATMRAHKLGVIVVASREFLTYTWSDFFTEIRPQLSQAFRRKLDEATLLNVDNPFANSVEQAIESEGNIVEGGITYDNILALQDVLLENNVQPNAFVSKVQNATALRGARDEFSGESLFDRATESIDGLAMVNFDSDEMEKGQLYAGDWDNLLYGIPYPINYEISTQGQLSTITNADGSPVNLFEQELIAMRATMDVATHILRDDAFARLDPSEIVE